MKKKYFLAAVCSLAFAIFGAKAQFTDDFNWIDLGECPYWWGSWGGECITANNGGCVPPYGGYIRPSDPGSGDSVSPVLNLGNKTSGQWSLNFCMYVPTGREAYFNLQGQVPVGGGEWMVGNIYFNQDTFSPGEGLIDDSALGAVNFTFPHDAWFDVEMNFDLTGGMDNATWEFIIAGNEVLPEGTALTNSDGDIPTSLGGVNFFSLSMDNEMFIDYVEYTNETPDPLVGPYWDDMEYDTPLAADDWWEYGPIAIDDTYAYEGTKSGYMYPDGSATSVLNFGNKIFGLWYNVFYMYVPSGKEAAFSIQDQIPFNDDSSIVGDILFNEGGTTPGVGRITDSALGEVTFNFPHDQWFRIYMEFDITAGISIATWYLDVDDNIAIPSGTLFTNSNGDIPTSLGGLVFKASSIESEFWVDNIIFTDFTFGIDDFSNTSFSLSPNPAQDEVRITTDVNFESVRIYSLEGKLVQQIANESTLDVSSLPSGIYFVTIHNGASKSVQKLIKR